MEKSLKAALKNLKENESIISMTLGALVLLVSAILVLNYFRSRPTPQISEESSATISAEVAEDLKLDTGEIAGLNDTPGALISPTKAPKPLGGQTHTVRKGEHLWMIAEEYYGSGYNWVDIAQANKLPSPGQIETGIELAIPKVVPKLATNTTGMAMSNDISKQPVMAATGSQTISGTSYTVDRGDTLWGIALRAYGDGFRWMDIYEANKSRIAQANLIEVGQNLSIPR